VTAAEVRHIPAAPVRPADITGALHWAVRYAAVFREFCAGIEDGVPPA